MAKELPYFKFEPAEWLTGRISLQPFEVQGAYIHLCSVYWQKLACAKRKDSILRVGPELYQKLVDNQFILEDGEQVKIPFLDKLLKERMAYSERMKEIGSSGGKAKAKRTLSKGKAKASQKRREEKRREGDIETPTLQMCIDYFETLMGGHELAHAQAQKFFNHYDAVGWMRGDNPIVNWRSAASKWISNEKVKPQEQSWKDRYN